MTSPDRRRALVLALAALVASAIVLALALTRSRPPAQFDRREPTDSRPSDAEVDALQSEVDERKASDTR